jgi:hypothetical protein
MRPKNPVTQKPEIDLGQPPSDEDPANELQMNMDEFYRFQHDANACVLFSLDANLSCRIPGNRNMNNVNWRVSVTS